MNRKIRFWYMGWNFKNSLL